MVAMSLTLKVLALTRFVVSLASDLENNVTYVDNFLEPEALDEIERYCLETTAWFDTRTGYVGAYREGFQPPALLRAAEQVRAGTAAPSFGI